MLCRRFCSLLLLSSLAVSGACAEHLQAPDAGAAAFDDSEGEGALNGSADLDGESLQGGRGDLESAAPAADGESPGGSDANSADGFAAPRVDDALGRLPWFGQWASTDSTDQERAEIRPDVWLSLPDRRQGRLQTGDAGPALSAWLLRALNGARLTLRVESAVGEAGFSPVVMLYGPQRPDGLFGEAVAVARAEVDSASGFQVARIARFDVARPGVYLVLVGARAAGVAGAYRLTTGCAGVCRDLACPRVVFTDYCSGPRVRDASGCPTTACAAPDEAPQFGDADALDADGGFASESTADASDTSQAPSDPYDRCGCGALPLSPVCGSDGASYPNACLARCAGVAVRSSGPCETATPGPRCATDADCLAGARCEAGGCIQGVTPPEDRCAACPADWSPVCGADGLSYTNRCRAECKGAVVVAEGECGQDPTANGCRCPAGGDPVCDESGRTWANECEARCAAAPRTTPGACGRAGEPPIPCVDDRGCPSGYRCLGASPAGEADDGALPGQCAPDPEGLVPGGAAGGCVVTGCLGEICADGPRRSEECRFAPLEACISAQPGYCRRGADGTCGWYPDRAEVAACMGGVCTQDVECGRGRLCIQGACLSDPCACDGPDCAGLCAPR